MVYNMFTLQKWKVPETSNEKVAFFMSMNVYICRFLNIIKKVTVPPVCLPEVPVWACVDNDQLEDFILQPVAVYRDPFRRGQHRLVLCQMIDIHGKPACKSDFIFIICPGPGYIVLYIFMDSKLQFETLEKSGCLL